MLKYLIQREIYTDFNLLLGQESDLYLLQVARELYRGEKIEQLLEEAQSKKYRQAQIIDTGKEALQTQGFSCGFWSEEKAPASSSRAYLLKLGYTSAEIDSWRDKIKKQSLPIQEISTSPSLFAESAITKRKKITWGSGLFSFGDEAVKPIENSDVVLFYLCFFDHLFKNLQESEQAIKQQFAAVRPHFVIKGDGIKRVANIFATIDRNGEKVELPLYELKKIGLEKRLFGVFIPEDNNGPALLCLFYYGEALHKKAKTENALQAWAISTNEKPLSLNEIAQVAKAHEANKASCQSTLT